MTPGSAAGFLVIDKPAGRTSRAVVDRAQRWFPRGTKVGHTGTLDPLATGVLVHAIGPATRLTEYVQRMTKVYRAAIVLGARSATDDADGEVTPVADAAAPDVGRVTELLASFVGTIAQVPPDYSAAHVAGRRAYALARRGEDVKLDARPVEIDAITLDRYDYPHLDVTVTCGKGTYIRSIARDLGEALGCGGYIGALRRTRVGHFDETQAVTLDGADVRERLQPLTAGVVELPRVVVSAADAARLRNGVALRIDAAEGDVAIFDNLGSLLAVGQFDSGSRLLRPGKVFGNA